MRIAFFSAANDPWGAENSLLLICEQLIIRGHEVRVITRSSGVADFFRKLQGLDVVLIDHEGGKISTLMAFAKYLRSESSLKDWVKVVFSMDLAPLAALSTCRRSTGWVYDVHDTPAKLHTRLVLRLLMRHYDMSICISRFASKWGQGARRTAIVPRPIPIPSDVNAHGRGRAVVGVVGRIHPDKNLRFAVEAFREVANHMSFTFIGTAFGSSTSYANDLKKYALHQLGSEVQFPGRLEVDEAFLRIDVLFVANAKEPSGRTVGEAMVRGIPVVVPSSGGAPEYIDGTAAGLVYQEGDPASAASCLEHLIDRSRRQTMGAEGRRIILERRTPDVVAEKYIAALAESTREVFVRRG